MKLRSVGNGERLSVVSSILLCVLMFFDWFGTQGSGGLQLFSVGRNAWQALDYLPIVLVIAIMASLGVVVLRLSDTSVEPVTAELVVAILGAASAAMILFRIIQPPDFGTVNGPLGGATIEGVVRLPIFLALAAALGIALGGCLAVAELRRGP